MASVVLLSPQLSENIGAVARAMKNFGIMDLRVVTPCCDVVCDESIAMSAGAEDILQSAKTFESLEKAVADKRLVFGSIEAPRDMNQSFIIPEQVHQHISSDLSDTDIAFVFGCERSGMNNEEMCQCQHIISIPTNRNFSSLNLAQAVLLILYEHSKGRLAPSFNGGEVPASQADLNCFFDNLERYLDGVNYWRVDHKKPVMWRNVRNIFMRTQLTDQDIRTLQGVIRYIRR